MTYTPPTSVYTVLGDSKEVTRTWPDGSFECPWCMYPVPFPERTCRNPWCQAHPGWGKETLRKHRAEVERKAREEKDREAHLKAVKEAYRERAHLHLEWEQAQIAECSRRGTCRRCLFQPGWERVKFIKHKGTCPKER